MLSRVHRLRQSSQFTQVSRQGSTARRGSVIAHVLTRGTACGSSTSEPTRVGLVVGRQLGGSVQRHRLSRQLRAIARPILAEVPGGLDIVIRPTPIAASVSFQQLSTDVGEAIRAAYRKVSAGRAWESV